MFATSAFSLHSLISAIGTAQAIVIAVSKPVSAKIADGELPSLSTSELVERMLTGTLLHTVFGRAEAMVTLVVFYVVGYASASCCRPSSRGPSGSLTASPRSCSRRWFQQHPHLCRWCDDLHCGIRLPPDHASDRKSLSRALAPLQPSYRRNPCRTPLLSLVLSFCSLPLCCPPPPALHHKTRSRW